MHVTQEFVQVLTTVAVRDYHGDAMPSGAVSRSPRSTGRRCFVAGTWTMDSLIIIIVYFLERHVVVISQALAAGRISVQWKPEWVEKVLSLDLKTERELLTRTVCGSEFYTEVAETRTARLVLVCWRTRFDRSLAPLIAPASSNSSLAWYRLTKVHRKMT